MLEVWSLVLAGLWLLGHLRGHYSCGPVFSRGRPMVVCVFAWLGYLWLQLLPLPMPVLEVLSPEAARWHAAAATGMAPLFAPLSLDRYGSLDGALKSAAYGAFFLLSLVLLRTRARIRVTTYALIASGVLQALYGATAAFGAADVLASGTFVNRNHFAAYLIMCLSVGIGVLIASFSGERSQDWRAALRGAVEWLITPQMALRLLLVVMVIALVLTRSRMGNFAFLVSLFVAGTIGLVLSRKATRAIVVLLVSLMVIDVLIVGAYFGTQRLIDRLGETTLAREDRGQVAMYAFAMWKDYPVFGSGIGSFPAVFPRYSAQATVIAYTHAHNDYLEFAAETGLVGLALLGSMVALTFGAALRAQQIRRDSVMRGISFASIMATVAMLIHCSAEFVFQIPANSLTFMLLLAFGWISRYGEPQA